MVSINPRILPILKTVYFKVALVLEQYVITPLVLRSFSVLAVATCQRLGLDLIRSSFLLFLLRTHQETCLLSLLPAARVFYQFAFLEGHGSAILFAINRRRFFAPPWCSGSAPEGPPDLLPQHSASAGQSRHSCFQAVCLFSCGRTVSSVLWSHFCATPMRIPVMCMGMNPPVQQEITSPSVGDTSRGPPCASQN